MKIPKFIQNMTKLAEHQIGEQIFGKTVKDIWFRPTCVEIVFSDDSLVRFDPYTDGGNYPDGILTAIYYKPEKT